MWETFASKNNDSPRISQKGKINQSKWYSQIHSRFIGSQAPSQLVNTTGFYFSRLDYGQLTLNSRLTQNSDRLSVILDISCNLAWERTKSCFPVFDTYHYRLFNKTTYCTKLISHMGFLSSSLVCLDHAITNTSASFRHTPPIYFFLRNICSLSKLVSNKSCPLQIKQAKLNVHCSLFL